MSNFNEEKNDGLGHGYFENSKKLKEENEKNTQIHKEWEQQNGPKPTRDALPKVLTDREIHDKAKARTVRQNEEQAKLDKGLVQQPKQQSTLTPEQKANREAIRKRKERKAEKSRKRGDEGRTMDR